MSDLSHTWSVPTVEIRTGLYVCNASGRGVWRPARPLIPNAREYVYSATELQRVLITYGRLVGGILHRAWDVSRFRLTVHRVPGRGRIVGGYEWRRSDETGLLVPAQEPLIFWGERSCRTAC